MHPSPASTPLRYCVANTFCSQTGTFFQIRRATSATRGPETHPGIAPVDEYHRRRVHIGHDVGAGLVGTEPSTLAKALFVRVESFIPKASWPSWCGPSDPTALRRFPRSSRRMTEVQCLCLPRHPRRNALWLSTRARRASVHRGDRKAVASELTNRRVQHQRRSRCSKRRHDVLREPFQLLKTKGQRQAQRLGDSDTA
jgi:hypothetical protein